MKVKRVPSVRAVVLYSIICGVLALPITSLAQAVFAGIRSLEYVLVWLLFEAAILSPIGALFGLLMAFLGLLFRDIGATGERPARAESLLLGTGQIVGLMVCYITISLFAPRVLGAGWEVLAYATAVGFGGYLLSMRGKMKQPKANAGGSQ